jgi:hypothetical protein
MDVKLPKVKKNAVFEDNEEKIQYLVENHLINKAGGFYKRGRSLQIEVWCWRGGGA